MFSDGAYSGRKSLILDIYYTDIIQFLDKIIEKPKDEEDAYRIIQRYFKKIRKRSCTL